MSIRAAQLPWIGQASIGLIAFCCVAANCSTSLARFGTNLVVNGSFEEFAVLSSDLPIRSFVRLDTGEHVDLNGWDEEGLLTLNSYEGQFKFRNPPEDSGVYAIFGSRQSTARLSQTTDLSFATTQIAAHQARFSLSGFLGSFERYNGVGDPYQSDIAELSVEFLDHAFNTLELTTVVGPASPSEVGLDTSVVANFSGFYETDGAVPAGAEFATISIDLLRDPRAPSSFFNNANVDLVGFQIRVVPEPATGGLLALSASIAICVWPKLRSRI